MKPRLFWKILIGLWVVLAAITAATGLIIILHMREGKQPLGHEVIERHGRLELASAAWALESGGTRGLKQLLDRWPMADRQLLRIYPPGALAGADGASGWVVLAAAVPTAGGVYHLEYRANGDALNFPPPPPGVIPFQFLVLDLVGALGFSAALALYLTRPIQVLRRGFDRLAQGDLTVRLRSGMGRRRDEIADLAEDFDRMAERLEAMVASRRRLLHDISHELRSPLARLQMAIGLYRQNPERLAVTLERIEIEAERMNGMVGELLALARVEDGARPLDDYFDLADLVRAVAADARFEAGPSGVVLRANVDRWGPDATHPTVKGSAELMRRGLDNVVRNALRFSDPGQVVEIDMSVDTASRRFTITVQDDGPGVRPDALAAIFEPFVRGLDDRSSQGFGLGLAIARRAVLAHEGAIKARNRAEGGLAVTIELPFFAVSVGV